MVDQLRLAAPSVRDSGPQIRHLTILPHERVTLPRGGQTPSDHFSSVTQRRYLRVPPERAQLLNDPVVPQERDRRKHCCARYLAAIVDGDRKDRPVRIDLQLPYRGILPHEGATDPGAVARTGRRGPVGARSPRETDAGERLLRADQPCWRPRPGHARSSRSERFGSALG